MPSLIVAAALALLLTSVPARAMEPFVVTDIRIEGIQRTEAGTVFSYLPVKVGDTLDDEKAAAAIKALFGTGFFKDVRLEAEGGVLVVVVEERPAIGEVSITGMKEFDQEQIKTALKQVGLAESRIFDRSLLDKAEQELKRQYISRGKYAVEIRTTVTPLERNRVAINFDITEGDIARIRRINIVGAQAFKEDDLLDLFVLSTPGWLTWYTKNDQYSKQKLSADLETLRSHYLNRGYLEFAIDSTQVSITPDRQDIYITVNITEGPKYSVSGFKLAGEMLLPEEELTKLIQLRPGDVFSREKLTESSKAITDRLGNDGYAFANVNAQPEVDKEKQQVFFTFFIDPGRKVYVRRINIAGNNKTRDEVIRREMRQLEGAHYSGEKINRSRQRIERLGYFKEVNIETPAVPGTTDQVDMNVSVEERSTGQVLLGAGFSSSEGILFSGSVSQNNVFGSGNALSLQFNSGDVNTVYSVSYTNPYFTVDGISLGFDAYRRDLDSSRLSVGRYNTKTLGIGGRLGLPVTERDVVNVGLAYENTSIDVFNDSPQRYKQFVTDFGDNPNTVLATLSWARDQRDSVLYPTKGTLQRITGEFGLPAADLKYYKASYQHQYFYPVSRTFTLLLDGEVGYADGYGGKDLPFFKNFYAGGINSVRGYETASIGPRDIDNESIGGNSKATGSAELLFPFPGLKGDKSIRMGAFVDGGYIGSKDPIFSEDTNSVRFSAGLSVHWFSPLGPLKFSFAEPLNKQEGDRLQRFQFTLGGGF